MVTGSLNSITVFWSAPERHTFPYGTIVSQILRPLTRGAVIGDGDIGDTDALGNYGALTGFWQVQQYRLASVLKLAIGRSTYRQRQPEQRQGFRHGQASVSNE
jgi:hypothetical protein